MRLWQNIRNLFQRRQCRFGRGVEFAQSSLRSGHVIQPEQAICHRLTVVFSRADVDDATYRRLGDRQAWVQLLEEDRDNALRDADQQAFDAMLLALLAEAGMVTIAAPTACPPLPLEWLALTSVGYNERFLDLAERCDQALAISVCDLNSMPLAMRAGWPLAHHLARVAARETGGIILDSLSERWWSLDCWAAIDPDPAQGAISDWISVQDVVDDSGPSAMHTHGMLHFGLPDLELCGVPRFLRSGACKLVNAACRKLITRAVFDGSGVRVGDELTITGDDVRAALLASEETEPGNGAAGIRLLPGDPQAALVENRLLRILPAERYGTGTEGLAACLLDLFPEEPDDRGEVADEQEMHAAHLQALETLPAERKRFDRGLRSAEKLAVKVRFPYGDQGASEYMWVEVQNWSGEGPHSTIGGVLLNQPLYRPDLKLGQFISVEQSVVYDWLRVTVGGRQEGNFTAAALEM